MQPQPTILNQMLDMLADEPDSVALVTDFTQESGIASSRFVPRSVYALLYGMKDNIKSILVGKAVTLRIGDNDVRLLFTWRNIPYQTQISKIQKTLGVDSDEYNEWELHRNGVSDAEDLALRLGLPNRSLQLVAFIEQECESSDIVLTQNALAIFARILESFYSIELLPMTLSVGKIKHLVNNDVLADTLDTKEIRLVKKNMLQDYTADDVLV